MSDIINANPFETKLVISSQDLVNAVIQNWKAQGEAKIEQLKKEEFNNAVELLYIISSVYSDAYGKLEEEATKLAEKVQRCFKTVHGKSYKQKVEASVRVSLNDYSYSHRDVLYGIGYSLACQEIERKYNTKITLSYGEVARFIETLALLKEDSLNWKIVIDLCNSDFDDLSEKEAEDASEVHYEGSVEKVVPIPQSVLDKLAMMKSIISSMLKARQDISKIANDLKQEDELIKKASAMITQRAIQNNEQLQTDVAAVMANFGSYDLLLNGSNN